MASTEAVSLENHLKLFVEMKLGDYVTLELRSDCIVIRPAKKVGSTSLGSFWVRVLQSYFDRKEYTYSKTYCRRAASEIIMVSVDEYVIEVHLRTGLLTIDGHDAYRWFKLKFPRIMKSYDKQTGALPVDYFNDQVLLDSRKEMRKSRTNRRNKNVKEEKIEPDRALLSSDIILTEEEETMIMERLLSSISLTQPLPTQELVTVDVYPQCMSGLDTVAIKDADTFVYPVWRQSLNKWFGQENYQVYMATQSFDCDRLRDVYNLGLKNKATMNLCAVYCPLVVQTGTRMSDIKAQIMKGLTNDEQLFAEYRLFNKFHYPQVKNIGCNFIAGVRKGVVEILMTSAAFNSQGLAATNNLISVTFTKMLEEDFKKNLLDQLTSI